MPLSVTSSVASWAFRTACTPYMVHLLVLGQSSSGFLKLSFSFIHPLLSLRWHSAWLKILILSLKLSWVSVKAVFSSSDASRKAFLSLPSLDNQCHGTKLLTQISCTYCLQHMIHIRIKHVPLLLCCCGGPVLWLLRNFILALVSYPLRYFDNAVTARHFFMCLKILGTVVSCPNSPPVHQVALCVAHY